jgi:hypothetical protein
MTKNSLTVFLLLILPLASCTQSLLPIHLGAQWNGARGFQFADACDAPNEGGHSCVYFPNGARIHAISWQTSNKSTTELLYQLYVSSNRTLPSSGSATLITAGHHVPGQRSIVTKDIELKFPILVPLGWYVWIQGEGPVSFTAPNAEAQITLFVEPTPSFYVTP